MTSVLSDFAVLEKSTRHLVGSDSDNLDHIDLTLHFWSRTLAEISRNRAESHILKAAVQHYDSLLAHRARKVAHANEPVPPTPTDEGLQPIGSFNRRTLYLLQSLGSPIQGEEVVRASEDEKRTWSSQLQKERKEWEQRLEKSTKPTLIPLYSTNQRTLTLLDKLKNKALNSK